MLILASCDACGGGPKLSHYDLGSEPTHPRPLAVVLRSAQAQDC